MKLAVNDRSVVDNSFFTSPLNDCRLLRTLLWNEVQHPRAILNESPTSRVLFEAREMLDTHDLLRLRNPNKSTDSLGRSLGRIKCDVVFQERNSFRMFLAESQIECSFTIPVSCVNIAPVIQKPPQTFYILKIE